MESLPSPQNPKKRLFSETVSSSPSMDDDEDVVVLAAPPVTSTRKSHKRKEAVVVDVIGIDDDEDSDRAMVMDKKRVHRSNTVSHKVAYGDYFLDEIIDVDDESAQLQSHFDDNVDIPPRVEAPMPHIPWFDPPKRVKITVPGTSFSETKYQQSAKGFASVSHKMINVDGPSSSTASDSNGDYTGLYLDEVIDIDEYAQMTAYFDEIDVPPGKEAPIPYSLSSSDFRSSIKAVSRSSSDLKIEKDSVSHLGISSSWKLSQVSSTKRKQSYLQHQESASSLPVGGDSSKFQKQTNVVNGFKQFDTIEDHSDHHYTKKSNLTKEKNLTKKIQEEWKILEKDLPDMIFVRAYETRMDLLRAVIIGAEGTPYHDGLFFFDVSFPSTYPNGPPQVYYHSGGLRLNPNLYHNGKVCLSLLNTWSGGPEQMWIPGKSTMLQVLVSIQGLVLNADPYFNEPGLAGSKGTEYGGAGSKKYNEDTFILSLRTMVYTMKKPPKHFEDFVFGHFRNRAHDILGACKAYMDGAEVGCLVKGQIQSVNGNSSCSPTFKNSVAGFLPTLIKQFTEIGVKDCEKFLPPTTLGNMQNGSVHQAATLS